MEGFEGTPEIFTTFENKGPFCPKHHMWTNEPLTLLFEWFFKNFRKNRKLFLLGLDLWRYGNTSSKDILEDVLTFPDVEK